jgi:hypothetical protein
MEHLPPEPPCADQARHHWAHQGHPCHHVGFGVSLSDLDDLPVGVGVIIEDTPMSPATSRQREAFSTPMPVASANSPAASAESWNASTACLPTLINAAPALAARMPALAFTCDETPGPPRLELADQPVSLSDVGLHLLQAGREPRRPSRR